MKEFPILLILNLISQAVSQHEGGEEGGGEGGEAKEGFHVFHTEWHRVEVPYVIGLWILATTLVKICNEIFPATMSLQYHNNILTMSLQYHNNILTMSLQYLNNIFIIS